MSLGRELIAGLLTAFFSTFILGGSLILSISEGDVATALNNTSTPTATATPLPTTLPGEPTYTPSVTPLPTNTPTIIPPTTCPAPNGWNQITIGAGETLESLAETYHTSTQELSEANCLLGESLPGGAKLYVPPIPATKTPTKIVTPIIPLVCTPRYGWVSYLVKSGDTLFKIASAHGITVAQLQQANCLNTSTIYAGQQLLVPYAIATLTNTATPTPTATAAPPTATKISTATATTVPPTATNTTAPPSPTASASPLPTASPTPTTVPPTATNTPVPTLTSSPGP